MLFYNITEAAFRSGLMWVAVLLATMEVVVPGTTESTVANLTLREMDKRPRLSRRSKAQDTVGELKISGRTRL
jgi:hypothetical protein